jgi:hypothetical protein
MKGAVVPVVPFERRNCLPDIQDRAKIAGDDVLNGDSALDAIRSVVSATSTAMGFVVLQVRP